MTLTSAFTESPQMIIVENLCFWPCCHITFSNTFFYVLNNCQLLALVQHWTVVQSASLILLALPDACCRPFHSLSLHSRQEEGRRGKGGLQRPLTFHWLELCLVTSDRTKVAGKVAILAFPPSTVEADESKEGWGVAIR